MRTTTKYLHVAAKFKQNLQTVYIMAEERPLSIEGNDELLDEGEDLTQYLSLQIPTVTVTNDTPYVNELEEGEVQPKLRKRITPPKVQQLEQAPKTIDFVSQATRRRVESIIRTDGENSCKICTLVSRTRTGHRYHVSSHFITHLCGCGYSHYDTRVLSDHQKENGCTPFMYAVCRESLETYVRAMNITEHPTLHFYVYKPKPKLAATTSVAAATTAVPSRLPVDALWRAITALDNAADELRAVLRTAN